MASTLRRCVQTKTGSNFSGLGAYNSSSEPFYPGIASQAQENAQIRVIEFFFMYTGGSLGSNRVLSSKVGGSVVFDYYVLLGQYAVFSLRKNNNAQVSALISGTNFAAWQNQWLHWVTYTTPTAWVSAIGRVGFDINGNATPSDVFNPDATQGTYPYVAVAGTDPCVGLRTAPGQAVSIAFGGNANTTNNNPQFWSPFPGLFAEFRMWDVAPAPFNPAGPDIALNRANFVDGAQHPHLVHCWRMNENASSPGAFADVGYQGAALNFPTTVTSFLSSPFGPEAGNSVDLVPQIKDQGSETPVVGIVRVRRQDVNTSTVLATSSELVTIGLVAGQAATITQESDEDASFIWRHGLTDDGVDVQESDNAAIEFHYDYHMTSPVSLQESDESAILAVGMGSIADGGTQFTTESGAMDVELDYASTDDALSITPPPDLLKQRSVQFSNTLGPADSDSSQIPPDLEVAIAMDVTVETAASTADGGWTRHLAERVVDAYLPMDTLGANGELLDTSGNGHHATAQDYSLLGVGVTPATANGGNAIVSGNVAQITFNDGTLGNPSIGGTFTVAFSIRYFNAPNTTPLWSKPGVWAIQRNADSSYTFTRTLFSGGTESVTSSPQTHVVLFNQIVASYGPGGMRLYFNGVLIASNSSATATGTSTSPVKFGVVSVANSAIDDFLFIRDFYAPADASEFYAVAQRTGPVASVSVDMRRTDQQDSTQNLPILDYTASRELTPEFSTTTASEIVQIDVGRRMIPALDQGAVATETAQLVTDAGMVVDSLQTSTELLPLLEDTNASPITPTFFIQTTEESAQIGVDYFTLPEVVDQSTAEIVSFGVEARMGATDTSTSTQGIISLIVLAAKELLPADSPSSSEFPLLPDSLSVNHDLAPGTTDASTLEEAGFGLPVALVPTPSQADSSVLIAGLSLAKSVSLSDTLTPPSDSFHALSLMRLRVAAGMIDQSLIQESSEVVGLDANVTLVGQALIQGSDEVTSIAFTVPRPMFPADSPSAGDAIPAVIPAQVARGMDSGNDPAQITGESGDFRLVVDLAATVEPAQGTSENVVITKTTEVSMVPEISTSASNLDQLLPAIFPPAKLSVGFAAAPSDQLLISEEDVTVGVAVGHAATVDQASTELAIITTGSEKFMVSDDPGSAGDPIPALIVLQVEHGMNGDAAPAQITEESAPLSVAVDFPATLDPASTTSQLVALDFTRSVPMLPLVTTADSTAPAVTLALAVGGVPEQFIMVTEEDATLEAAVSLSASNDPAQLSDEFVIISKNTEVPMIPVPSDAVSTLDALLPGAFPPAKFGVVVGGVGNSDPAMITEDSAALEISGFLVATPSDAVSSENPALMDKGFAHNMIPTDPAQITESDAFLSRAFELPGSDVLQLTEEQVFLSNTVAFLVDDTSTTDVGAGLVEIGSAFPLTPSDALQLSSEEAFLVVDVSMKPTNQLVTATETGSMDLSVSHSADNLQLSTEDPALLLKSSGHELVPLSVIATSETLGADLLLSVGMGPSDAAMLTEEDGFLSATLDMGADSTQLSSNTTPTIETATHHFLIPQDQLVVSSETVTQATIVGLVVSSSTSEWSVSKLDSFLPNVFPKAKFFVDHGMLVDDSQASLDFAFIDESTIHFMIPDPTQADSSSGLPDNRLIIEFGQRIFDAVSDEIPPSLDYSTVGFSGESQADSSDDTQIIRRRVMSGSSDGDSGAGDGGFGRDRDMDPDLADAESSNNSPDTSSGTLSATIPHVGSVIAPFCFLEGYLSKLDIWNVALTKLGIETVTATTDSSSQAQKMAKNWDLFKETFLRDHVWNGAKTTIALTRFQNADLTDVVPAGRWSYAYVVPPSPKWVRSVRLNGKENRSGDKGYSGLGLWEEEVAWNAEGVGKFCILTDEAAAKLEYIFLVSDNDLDDFLTADMRWAMALTFAVHMASDLGSSNADVAQLEQHAEMARRNARRTDGQSAARFTFTDTTVADAFY